jgi:hypothetical protein
MRRILILLALTSAPAFCQDNAVSQQLDNNLRQRLAQILNPRNILKQKAPEVTLAPPGIVLTQREEVCSIPLLNVKPAGTPVHMPELRMPGGARGASGALAEPQVFDRIAVKPPAPACPAR